MDDLPLAPQPGETLDHLAGDWRIFQLKRGHRFSTDDLVTAWRLTANRPAEIRHHLDIGSGIGSVGLLTLWRLGDPSVRLTGIEAQEVSHGLARRTVALNGLGDRVTMRLGDLRDPHLFPEGTTFDTITGSPPYVPEGKGVISPVAQRAYCRMELRGSVFDYCESARRWLRPGGRFSYVMLAADPRTEQAPKAHGFTVLERYNYVFARHGGRHITTMVCARDEDGPFPPRVERELVIRGPDGEWTYEYMAFRREMGLKTEPPEADPR